MHIKNTWHASKQEAKSLTRPRSQAATMIKRTSAAAVATAVVDGGNIVVLTDHLNHPSSKTKKRRSSSSSRSSFMLPFVLAFAWLTLFIRILRPINGADDTLRFRRSDGKPSLQESSNDASLDDTDSTKKYKRTPKHKFPQEWQSFSYYQIRHHFQCQQRAKDMNKPLPSLQDWEFMRQTYTRLVDNPNQNQPWTDDVVPPTLGYSLVPGVPVPPPYYAKRSPGKGRGLFASRLISKGELVHDGQFSDVTFPSAMMFREFLFSLPHDYACDAAEWVWMQQLEKGGEYHVHLDMNIAALMNSGGAHYGDQKSKTVNAVPEDEYSGKFYATRDIQEGEEILTDYDVFNTKWSLVGLDGK